MTAIPGTNVAAMVVPFDDQDIYATHNDKYGRGGYRVCDTLAERDAIPDPRRKAGMVVYVVTAGTAGQEFRLGVGMSNADWQELPTTQGLTQVEATLPAGGATALDAVTLDNTRSCKWLVTVQDTAQQRQCMSEIAALHDGNTAQWVHYAKLGAALPVLAYVDVVSEKMVLSMRSQYEHPLDISVVRIRTMQ